MKTPVIELLYKLHKLEIEINYNEDGNIKYKSLKGKLDIDLISELKKYKSEIIEYLKEIERINEWKINEFNNIKTAIIEVEPKKVLIKDIELKYDFINHINKEYEEKVVFAKKTNEWIKIANEIAVISILNMFKNLSVFENNKQYTFNCIREKTKPKNERLLIDFLNILITNEIIEKVDNCFKLIKPFSEKDMNKKWSDFKNIDLQNNDNTLFYQYYKESIDFLLELFRGDKDPLSILFPNGDTSMAKSLYENNKIINLSNDFVGEIIKKLINSDRSAELKIMEIGAGIGGTTNHILNKIDKSKYNYYFTDISNFFISNFKKENSTNENINYGIFDINKPIEGQLAGNEKFDIVLCSNVLHNAQNIKETMSKLKLLLKKDGIFIILEQTEDFEYLHTSLEFNMDFEKVSDFRKTNGKILLTRTDWEGLFKEENINLLTCFPECENLKQMGMSLYIGSFNETYDIQKDLIDTYFKLNYNIDMVKILRKENIYQQENYVNKANRMDNKKLEIIDDDEYKILKEIWCKVLRLESVDDGAEFYSLGGDSLVLTQLISEVWGQIPKTKQWDWNVFINITKTEFTLYGLYKKIKAIQEELEMKEINISNEVKLSSSFIKYDVDKEKDIYIIIHDGTGGLNNYNHLIEQFYKLGLESKLYGLVYENEDVDASDLHMKLSEKYAALIFDEFKEYKNIKLIGYCVGGSIALETANILNKVYDKKIKEVVLISSYLNAGLVVNGERDEYINKCMNSDYIMALLFTEILGNEIPIDLDKKTIENYIKDTYKYDAELPLQKLNDINLFDKKYNGIDFKEIFSIMKKYFEAVSMHMPSEYDGRVTVIHGLEKTKNNFLESDRDFNGNIDVWKKFLKSEYRYYALNCDHFSSMNKKNAITLINIITGEWYV